MPTKIEWADETWNPITGCSVVSAGCTYCYAMNLAGTRLKDHPSRADLTRPNKDGHVWTGEIRFNPDWLVQPMQWKKPRRVFVCAHGDLFHEGVSEEHLMAIWAVMELAPQHDYIILTKRPSKMRDFINSIYRNHLRSMAIASVMEEMPHGSAVSRQSRAQTFLDRCRRGEPAKHIQVGVSVENQECADERVPILIDTLAARMVVSYEPALGPVDWRRIEPDSVAHASQGFFLDALTGQIVRDDGSTVCDAPGRLDCIIAGGESGKFARPVHPSWFRDTRDQIEESQPSEAEIEDGKTGCQFFFKQWGQYRPVLMNDGDEIDFSAIDKDREHWIDYHGHRCEQLDLTRQTVLMRWFANKTEAGRELDGQFHDDQPRLES